MNLRQLQVQLARERWVELRESLQAEKLREKEARQKERSRLKAQRFRTTGIGGMAFALRYAHRLTFPEIARRLGISVSAARAKCFRTAHRLRWRTRVPVVHSLYGETWSATNCWWVIGVRNGTIPGGFHDKAAHVTKWGVKT